MVFGLYGEGDKDDLIRPLKNDMKRDQVPHSEEWNYYLEKLKDNLHLCMCFSPAGDTLRDRCRNFPGLVSNTVID
jgi:dynein heavy chain